MVAQVRRAGIGWPRPGQPRKLSDAQIEQVIVRTLESKPPVATHWSTRTMAQAYGHQSDRDQPHLARLFPGAPSCRDVQVTKDPLFIDKVRDIVGLYLNHPSARWSCVWTKRATFRLWIARLLCCRCVLARSSGARMTTRLVRLTQLGTLALAPQLLLATWFGPLWRFNL